MDICYGDFSLGQGGYVDIDSSSHRQQNPRLYELIKDSPKTGVSPTVWAWPQLIGYLKVAGQPVQGPWPPHQEPRPEPDAESLPVAIHELDREKDLLLHVSATVSL
jgi:hypothetical protein